jgi:hypothetical protein
MVKIMTLLSLLLFVFRPYALDALVQMPARHIDGKYRSGNELLYFNSKDNIFWVKRLPPKSKDAIIPICYDTIAKGNFKVLAGNAVVLFKDPNFYKAKFDVKQYKYLSSDTIYIKIVLPEDDAFFPDRFRYLLNFLCTMRQVKSDTSLIKIPRSKLNHCDHDFLSLVVQDLSPQWVIEEEKPYQRIYFRIFDLLPLEANKNFLTVSLWNFSECFVERMDIQNDIIQFDGNNSIFWRGKVFRKINGY